MKEITAALPRKIFSPFGGEAIIVQTLPVGFVVEQYRRKCGVDVSPSFGSIPSIGLYECAETGYKFWRPESVAGDEVFYRYISHAWKNYYRSERWEYSYVRKFLTGKENLLEVGCGKGYFLKSIEACVQSAIGIEFNNDAICNKVTSVDVFNMSLEGVEATGDKFDVVCAFQVLEHVTDPRFFIEKALSCLNDGGTLILSTPNNESAKFLNQQDIFDAPPHHMGHFNSEVYRKIAERFDCTILKTVVEPQRATLPDSSEKTNSSMSHRTISMLARVLLNTSYRINNEPGDTILVFMRKGR